MKTLLTATALAIAFLAPAAEARVPAKQGTHASAKAKSVKTAKKAGKKTKKHAKKGAHKTSL
jgi:hypothetical protein